MFGRWLVQGFPDSVWLARRTRRGDIPAGAEPIAAETAAWQVETWFPSDGLGRQLLHQIHEELLGPRVQAPIASLGELRAGVRRALQTGALEAYRVREKLSSSSMENEVVPEPPKERPPVEKKTFVTIELVDDASPPQPVAYAKYRVELPDHSVREGILDDNGRATIQGIDEGECQVSFPSFHAGDWKQI